MSQSIIKKTFEVPVLYGTLPPNFKKLAEEAGMAYDEVCSDCGTSVYITFNWVSEAVNQNHPLIEALKEIFSRYPQQASIELQP